jgi:hypothetical protein
MDLSEILRLYLKEVGDEVWDEIVQDESVMIWSKEYTYNAYRNDEGNILIDSLDGMLDLQEIANADIVTTYIYRNGTFEYKG